MRTETEPGTDHAEVVLYLTVEEARELRDTVEGMLDTENHYADWHAHVASVDGRAEVTVAWQEVPTG